MSEALPLGAQEAARGAALVGKLRMGERMVEVGWYAGTWGDKP